VSVAVTAALQSWLGLAGTGVAMLLLFILGNPASGGVYPPEFLPGLFRDLPGWLPTGQATELVRAVEYFGGAASAGPLAGLVLWLLAGLAATALSGRRQPLPTEEAEEAEEAEPERPVFVGAPALGARRPDGGAAGPPSGAGSGPPG
jgi:hypothetical protein